MMKANTKENLGKFIFIEFFNLCNGHALDRLTDQNTDQIGKSVRHLSSQGLWTIFQGPLNGGGSNGGVSRSGLVLPFLSFFVLFGTFPICSGIFPICSGTLRGFSRLVLFLSLGLSRAPTRNSPERVRDTVWTFPEKSGKPPGLEMPPV